MRKENYIFPTSFNTHLLVVSNGQGILKDKENYVQKDIVTGFKKTDLFKKEIYVCDLLSSSSIKQGNDDEKHHENEDTLLIYDIIVGNKICFQDKDILIRMELVKLMFEDSEYFLKEKCNYKIEFPKLFTADKISKILTGVDTRVQFVQDLQKSSI
jgi:hypothetical protein